MLLSIDPSIPSTSRPRLKAVRSLATLCAWVVSSIRLASADAADIDFAGVAGVLIASAVVVVVAVCVVVVVVGMCECEPIDSCNAPSGDCALFHVVVADGGGGGGGGGGGDCALLTTWPSPLRPIGDREVREGSEVLLCVKNMGGCS